MMDDALLMDDDGWVMNDEVNDELTNYEWLAGELWIITW